MKKQHLPTIIISSIVAVVTLAIVVSGGVALFINNNQSTLKDPNVRPNPTAAAPAYENLIIGDAEPYDNADSAIPDLVVSNDMIIYRNGGSSSCPPILDKAYYDEQADSYVFVVKKYGNQICTADYSLLQQTVMHEDGTMISESADIVLE